ncbi:hypothetical protein TanjilG_00522 [Lupinus angustifolius]|uniref:Uncharacterized protein n=1 Tax=Lupinus angustifolius TaxID=3871 RepID=A0A4P1QXG9_LUPAN|nr:hypothetical protein TanjilG_00522 [Lupinus angustifolius]
MGYVLRVKLASFFTGAATASFAALYILHRDYKFAHQSFNQQRQKFEGGFSFLHILNVNYDLFVCARSIRKECNPRLKIRLLSPRVPGHDFKS